MIDIKDPDAVLDYSVDWQDVMTEGEDILESVWDVAPLEAEGVAIEATGIAGQSRWARVRAGIPGHVYRLTNRIVTSFERTDDRSFTIRIVDR